MNYIGKQLLIKLILLVTLGLLITYLLQQLLDIKIQNLEQTVKSFGLFAPMTYTILLFFGLSIPFNPISDYLVVNVAALVFPPYIAIISTFFAHSLAITVNYLVAKKFGWKIINLITNKTERENLHQLSAKITPSKVFFLRWLLPLTAVGIDIVSYSSAIAKIPFLKFYLLSIIPWTIINIIFFSTTAYVLKKYFVLFLVPGLMLAVIPYATYSLYKYLKKYK